MNYYRLRADAGKVVSIAPRFSCDVRVLDSFDGRELSQTWKPLSISAINVSQAGISVADILALATHVPVFSEKAASALIPLISLHGELLKLDIDQNVGCFSAFNVRSVLDCLDKERSEVQYFRSSGRIMDVKRFVLRESSISGIPIFKDEVLVLKDVFVSDDFRRTAQSAELTGFVFERVEVH